MHASRAGSRPPQRPHGRTRRQFLVDTARGVSGVAALGIGLGLHARRAAVAAPTALRPPGARDEEAFLAACVRCGLCVRDCPFDTLKLGLWTDPVATGTPFFTAREVPCEMCEEIPCVAACPTGALDPALERIDDARMGLAVLIDRETCLNALGLRCDVCYRVCPAIDEAITLETERNARTGHHALFMPVVHSEACTGCGLCEHACVLEQAAIRVVPLALAKGELGHHYRLGWEEKARAGESLLHDVLELPVRRPEARP